VRGDHVKKPLSRRSDAIIAGVWRGGRWAQSCVDSRRSDPQGVSHPSPSRTWAALRCPSLPKGHRLRASASPVASGPAEGPAWRARSAACQVPGRDGSPSPLTSPWSRTGRSGPRRTRAISRTNQPASFSDLRPAGQLRPQISSPRQAGGHPRTGRHHPPTGNSGSPARNRYPQSSGGLPRGQPQMIAVGALVLVTRQSPAPPPAALVGASKQAARAVAPLGAARLLAEVGDITRLPNKNHVGFGRVDRRGTRHLRLLWGSRHRVSPGRRTRKRGPDGAGAAP